MPDPVSGTGQARSGIQNILKLLDSGFRRNDKKWCFPTFYEFISISKLKKLDWTEALIIPKLSDFLLDLHQSLAHQGFAKILDISTGMPVVFANPYASRSQHISSQ
ncbi:MAG: hypothetical protein U9R02_16165 [Thermodesulfobacteriota bacterium]|nr:hypothetical protein [Thermodesulfobacteriota bacterium]